MINKSIMKILMSYAKQIYIENAICKQNNS